MAKFKSDYFESAEDLVEGRDDAWADVKPRRKNLRVVRRFSNGLSILSEKEAKELNREEIINHLTTYGKLAGQQTMFQSMVIGSNSLAEIIPDTGNPEADQVAGSFLSKIFNVEIFNYRGKFRNFWDKCCGEIIMAGGVPVGYDDNEGWLPKVQVDMFFPENTELDSDEIPYGFNPVQFSMLDIREFLASIKKGRGEIYNKNNLKYILKLLKRQRSNNVKASFSVEQYKTKSARKEAQAESESLIVFDCWEFYEVKTDDETGERYVSKTIFTDSKHLPFADIEDTSNFKNNPNETADHAWIISYEEKAFEDAYQWLSYVYVDTEIGGVKNTSTLRGVAEIMYPSASEMEDLLNLMLEGDKMRARPKFKVTEQANEGSLSKWDYNRDAAVPDGIENFEMGGSTGQLQTPLALLDGGLSSLSGTPINANNGRNSELRVQSLDRQRASQSVQTVRLAAAYDSLDVVLEQIVHRVLSADPDPGTPGYHDIRRVQKKLEEKGVDYKLLRTREDGRFKYLRVRAERTGASGDPQQTLESSDWLINNIANFPPASRPIILQQAVQLRTGDPDLAQRLVVVPQTIINQQKVVAEQEHDTIRRRSFIGQSISVNPGDIHQDHIPVHLLDMQTMLAAHNLEPWKMKDAIAFSGMTEHVSEHLQILLSNPVTNIEATPFLQDFQNLVNAAAPLIDEINEAEQQSEEDLPLKDKLELEFRQEELRLKALDLGVKMEDLQSIKRVREDRARLSNRQQSFRELSEAERLRLQRESIDITPSGDAEEDS